MANKSTDPQDDKLKKQEDLQIEQSKAVAENALGTDVDSPAQTKENNSKSKSSKGDKDEKDGEKYDTATLTQTEENVTKPDIPKAEEVTSTANIVDPFDVEVDRKRVDGRNVEQDDKDEHKSAEDKKKESSEKSERDSTLQMVSAGDSSHGIAPTTGGEPTIQEVNRGDALNTSQPVYEYEKVDADGKKETIQTNAVQSHSPTDMNPEDLTNPTVMHKVGVAETKVEVQDPLPMSKADEKKNDEKAKDESEDLTTSERVADSTLRSTNNIHEGVAYDGGHSVAPTLSTAVSTEEIEDQQEKDLKAAKKVNQMLSDPYGKHK